MTVKVTNKWGLQIHVKPKEKKNKTDLLFCDSHSVGQNVLNWFFTARCLNLFAKVLKIWTHWNGRLLDQFNEVILRLAVRQRRSAATQSIYVKIARLCDKSRCLHVLNDNNSEIIMPIWIAPKLLLQKKSPPSKKDRTLQSHTMACIKSVHWFCSL